MIKQSHISDDEAKNVASVLTKKDTGPTSTAQEVIDFYLNDPQYVEVHIVRCDACKSDLALEVLNPQETGRYFGQHHRGMRRVVLGTSGPLLSSRKRLDGLMGYKCMCGNNTIIADIEKGIVPQVKAPILHIPTIEPHHEAMIKLQMSKNGHKPDLEVSDDGKFVRHESFTAERLK